METPDYSVRPTLRALGGLLTLWMAWLFASHSITIFSHPGPILETCSRGRGRWICELEKLLLSVLPPAAHGPLLGIGGMLAAGFFLIATWLLVAPLFRVDKTDRDSRPLRRPRHHE